VTIILGAAFALVAIPAAVVLADASPTPTSRPTAARAGRAVVSAPALNSSRALAHRANHVIVGHSVKNDVSRPLRLLPPQPIKPAVEHEVTPNPLIRVPHRDRPDGAAQRRQLGNNMPAPNFTFEGIDFPGVNCNCFPPDTNGEVGLDQYVQIVNQGLDVYDKTDGTPLLPNPVDIATLWSGFGGACETGGSGDPVVLYDQLANRWVISQFATPTGDIPITDECVAVSQTSDATGSYNRYDFHLGSNFFDYPKIGVWPDAYYMSMNVFNAAGTAFLGPQPFAFDRSAMLAGDPATFITTGITNGPSEGPYLPADLDGSTPPPGVKPPDPFVEWPQNGTYKVYRFHVDWTTPASSTFTLAGSPAAAAFTVLCPNPSPPGNCVPQLGTTAGLDALADRLMFRAAYRNFGGHESLVANYTVSSSGVAGVRWFELRNLTSGSPSVFQESTYQPDTTWRWMGSAAMDNAGDLALGYSASSAAIHPQIRWAGRLVGDPANTLTQGEAHVFDGTGSQTNNTFFRWGDYSDMTVDPVDDCTFWYTQEYYAAPDANVNWKTRVGNFSFPSCVPPTGASVTVSKGADAPSVLEGGQIGYTVELVNSGPDPATGLSVTDALPAGNGVSWSVDSAGSSSGWSVNGSPPTQSLVYTPTTLAGSSATHVHVVSSTTGDSCGDYDNTASFTSTNGGSGTASASTTVDCVTITKTADAASVTAGSPIGFAVTLHNVGNVGATGVAVDDDLPGGTGINWTIGSGTDAGWSVSGSAPNQSLAYTPTTLAAGASTHVHVVSDTTSGSAGTYNNTASFTTGNAGSGSDSASTDVAAVAPCASPEGFNDINNLPGWSMRNNSTGAGAGTSSWFQGNPMVFTAQNGPDDSYIGANFQNTTDGTISNWLLTPTVVLQNGAHLAFFTRAASNPAQFPDRLQVRMSINGSSTNVGTSETSVGDFTTLLLDINPTYSPTGYPGDWTLYDLTVSGLGAPTTGRLAFRYFVENGGPDGANSDYIGIDTACTPPAAPPPPPPPPPPPAFRTLNVFKAGAGVGTVTSTPAGMNCGPVCTAQFSNGTSVTLTEAPSSSSKFAGWSGDCSGTATTCVLSMTADHSVTATFAKKPKCKVPKVVGLTLAKAKAKIRKAHCGVGKIKKKVSSRKKKGRVLTQKPKPGKTLPAGSKVNLTVGKGPGH
jgi:uncharacterized repeat protein (TIGR01451 family)